MNAGGTTPNERDLSVVPDPADGTRTEDRAAALESNLRALREDADEAAEESMRYLAVRVVPILLGLLVLTLLVRRRRRSRRARQRPT